MGREPVSERRFLGQRPRLRTPVLKPSAGRSKGRPGTLRALPRKAVKKMTSGSLRTTMTSAAVASVLLMAVAGCTAEPTVVRESTRPIYMDGPENTQRKDDAASAAVEALRKFSGAAASKESWLQDLTPLVTASMAHQVQDTDPPRLKPTLVHAAALEPPHAGTGAQVRVRIGTDTGEWTVVMTRAGAAAPWLASEIFTADLT